MQQRALVRARGLGAFRRAIVARALAGAPLDARRRAVIVPTRASGELLRQTIEQTVSAEGRTSVVLPDLLTRDEWLVRLHSALPGSAPLLSRTEREVLLERAARETAVRHPIGSALFQLRSGLVAAMLDFYDELRRRQRTVRRYVGALFEELNVERGFDRGSENLVQQTSYLGFTFLAYERAMLASGRIDEHVVRARLLVEQPTLPFDHLVIAVADHPSDPRGLWPADFDLVGRLAHLPRIDVIVTDEAHDAGFRGRLEQELPGIEEERAPDVPSRSILLQPAGVDGGPVFVCRDREEEVRAATRALRAQADGSGGTLSDAIAIVFQRPLPYLYLAQQVLIDARVPYQAFDALPLAAEPYAALLDVVLAVARTGGTREASIALLRSMLMTFEVDGRVVSLNDAGALDLVLSERRVTGVAETYDAEVTAFAAGGHSRQKALESLARRAARAAAEAHRALEPVRTAITASAQVGAIAAFLRAHERTPEPGASWRERHLRARAAVLTVLDELTTAFARHDDRPRDVDALTGTIHHAVEAQTFTPRRGDSGVHLVDAVAARFGDFDHVHLVGMVETDWPEKMRRNIFYASGLLKVLGWPQEPDQMRAQHAAFRDLVGLARLTTRLSAFQLEGDAVVTLSPVVELIRDVPVTEAPIVVERPTFADEIITRAVPPTGLDPESSEWLRVRHQRPVLSTPEYSGYVDAQPARAYSVSRVDRYVACPFKYFSESVLRLAEERDEMAGLTPIERGTLLHLLFERFYGRWRDRGENAITQATLPDALALFSAIAAEELDRLPDADRALEHTRLLGSIVGTGVAERVFELEVDSSAPVRTRELEWALTGSFDFPLLGGLSKRAIEIRGKADRIDILADGSLRVIDYKLGRMPDLKSSVQIAVYAHCARQMLEARDGHPHPVSAAMYLAFGDDRRLAGPLGGPSDPVDFAVTARATEFAKKVDDIEAGVFPPRPKQAGDCQWCAYAGVCRKEYVAQDDETTESV